MPRLNVTDDETILHDTERRRCRAPFVVPNLNGAAGRATCCRSSGSQGACARSMCAVLCRTWLPKSKAELVGRGFDIGVASSSSPPLSTRSDGPWDGGMMSALYTTPSVRSSPSLLCQTSCSLARSLGSAIHSLILISRLSVRATPGRRPAHHPSIPFFVMPLQLTIKANRRSERLR